MQRGLSLGVMLALGVGVAACVAPTPTATPPPTFTPAPTATPAPTFTPSPTAVPPTATPLPVTPVAPVTGLPAGTGGYPWWSDSVFYEVFVRSFFDSNGDGVGDLNGLTAKLDYLNDGNPATTADLGVTALWLMPIFPSPSYHGYDVTDYYSVNPAYGTLDDLKKLLAEAHKRGIRVILDLVLNHTSSQHPWFVAAQDPHSTYRDWYVWSKTNPGESAWYPGGGGYYYAAFTSTMPDLNYTNPAVTEKMDDVARFWLQEVGVDGFRLDAAKYLIEEGPVRENSDATHAWLRQFRSFYKALKPDALTVGEIWSSSVQVADYIQGDQLDLAFDFDLAQALIISTRAGKVDTAQRVLSADVSMFKPGQFATFLSNHDQSRALSQLAGKPEKGKVAATLLLTAPGVPFIYYGEEIGMLGLKPDEQLRTPMQWTAAANSGFTTGTPWELPFSDYAKGKNVADESADPHSLLAHYRALVRLRNEHAALRVGDLTWVDASPPAVYAIVRSMPAETVLTVVNLSNSPVSDYTLALAAGPLTPGGRYRAAPLMGSGPCADLSANGQGGFDAYHPVAELGANSSLILQLQPADSK